MTYVACGLLLVKSTVFCLFFQLNIFKYVVPCSLSLCGMTLYTDYSEHIRKSWLNHSPFTPQVCWSVDSSTIIFLLVSNQMLICLICECCYIYFFRPCPLLKRYAMSLFPPPTPPPQSLKILCQQRALNQDIVVDDLPLGSFSLQFLSVVINIVTLIKG